MKIAVIGSGISGNVAAYHLSRQHDVTLFEKRDRLGGHSATVDIGYDHPNDRLSVDTGFIVYNELNYPGLTQLFSELGVETEQSNMSFGFSANAGAMEWSGQSLSTVFAQRRNLLNPFFWQMLRDIFRFNKAAARDHEAGLSGDETLGQWLDRYGFSNAFRNRYLLPMGAAIWSTPAAEIEEFPARSFLHFFYNHRLINNDRPQWRTVRGGSREYVKKLSAASAARTILNAAVTSVKRRDGRVWVSTEVNEQAHEEAFDQVVFATHSDQALAALSDASAQERAILSAVRYLPNQVYLHCDARLMPRRRRVWSSWNYLTDGQLSQDGTMTVSYWMNLLQNLDRDKLVFVTLNPPTPPAAEKTFGHFVYDHPQFDRAALHAQENLDTIQGMNGVWFCGAWTGYGFHEDGLQSALRVCAGLEAATAKNIRAAAE